MDVDDLSRLRIERTKYQTQRNKRKRYFSLIMVLAIFAVGGILYGTGILKPATKVEIVNVTTIYPSQTFTLLNASGYVVAQRKSAVSSKITSWLVSLFVEEGSIVKKGEIIATLENKDVLAALDKAKANIEVARFELEHAEAELTEAALAFNRTKELLESEFAAPSEFDAAEARYKSAIAAVAAKKAALQAAEAALKEAEVNLEYTYIRAPFDAVVLTKTADVGDIVTPVGAAANVRASVVTIADMDSLQVEADVSESNIKQVKTGQPCEIQLDALPNERFRGEVHMIVPTADRSKASVLVKVAFIDKDSSILPEMSAKVAFLKREVTKKEQKPVKAVPISAIAKYKGRDVVYVVTSNRAVEKKIEVGRRLDNMVEILSGLEIGDKVVLSPQGKIKDGKRVKIIEE
ncbi:MAG: AcrA/AcrE family multidrug efflux protein [Candidatus Scalindua rubra]|uniref:AcrA/AcrE family multidrug efflux protein n=1 Tax=Candidatus Scalindua rubra TaxID=1872076 RepID=A0A1E3XC01_9BACT|nr:MAG: AcrA/AcrE family multidrug efflux protein [Candidatus Scalindua rubra]